MADVGDCVLSTPIHRVKRAWKEREDVEVETGREPVTIAACQLQQSSVSSLYTASASN